MLGGVALACGVAAWLIPYRWNPFKLKRLFRGMLSDSANAVVPKVIGTILALIGALVLAGTAIVGRFT